MANSCNICNSSSYETIFIKDRYNIVKCLSCGLVYIENPLKDDELKKLYSFDSDYHKCFSDANSYQCKRQSKLAYKKYKYLKRHSKKGRVLDIGCSAGFFLKIAKDNGWEARGVEISGDTSQIARDRYGLNVLTGDLEVDSFSPGSFDAVTLWDTLEHVRDPRKTMSIVNKVLNVGGTVIISTPDIEGLFPRCARKISGVTGDWIHPEPPHHLYQFSKNTLRMLLELSGFELIRMYYERIPITYTFKSFKILRKSLHSLLRASMIVPLSFVGPWIKSGDIIVVVARKIRGI